MRILGSRRGKARRKPSPWDVPAVFSSRCLAAAMEPFCSHLIGQNIVTLPHLTARETGKCSLSKCPATNQGFYYYGRRDFGYWETIDSLCHSELEINHQDMSSMCCSQMLVLRTSANLQKSTHWALLKCKQICAMWLIS